MVVVRYVRSIISHVDFLNSIALGLGALHGAGNEGLELSGVGVLSVHLVDLDVVAAALVDLLLSAKVLHLQENGVSVDGLGQLVLVSLTLASSLVLGSSKVESLLDLLHLNETLLLDLRLLGLDDLEVVLLRSVPLFVGNVKI